MAYCAHPAVPRLAGPSPAMGRHDPRRTMPLRPPSVPRSDRPCAWPAGRAAALASMLKQASSISVAVPDAGEQGRQAS